VAIVGIDRRNSGSPAVSALTRPRTGNIAAILLALCTVAHLLMTRLSWSGTPLQTDTGMWAYIGGRILDGALPYRDLWESKPPGIYYTFAIIEWIFGRGTDQAFLWLDAVLSLAVFAVTYRIARFFTSRVAAAGAVFLLSLVFCHRVLADWGDNVEKFVALFEMLACFLLMRSFGASRSWIFWLAAGLCCGFAGLFKQTGILFLVAASLTILGLGIRENEETKTAIRRIALMVAGAAIIWLPVTLCMLSAGMFPQFWQQAVKYDLLRVGSGDVERSRLLSPAHWSSVYASLRLAFILLGPALLGAYLTLRRRRDAKRKDRAPEQAADRRIMFVLMYWLLTTAVFPLAPYGYGHYLLQAAPPAAVLVAMLFDRLRECPEHYGWTAATTLTIAIGLWPLIDHFRFTFEPDYKYRRVYSTMRVEDDHMTDVLRKYTRQDELVMLWPPDYAVSYYSHRRTPLEISNSDVIVKGKSGRLSPPMPELLARLTKAPPDVIMDSMTIGVSPPPPGRASGEPTLIAPPDNFPLAMPPDDNSPSPEDRLLSPLRRWVQRDYGGQQCLDVCITYYRGRPWRPWQEVLVPRK
jgi:hypothetical protein